MSISATNPSSVSATYNLWAISMFQVQGDGLVRIGQTDAPPPVAATATLVKYRIREDGLAERSPLVSDRLDLSIPDLYALAATDSTIGAALTSIVTGVTHFASGQGLL